MRADYVMVGGFLGAGKTTALLRLAEHFTAQGRRVGLITNDQSQGLVDTSMVHGQGYPVEEITGGCFCCRLKDRFVQADVVSVSARTGANLDGWFERLSGTLDSRPAMAVDYDLYADGEALLGWLNATSRLSADTPFDGNQFLRRLADNVQKHLADRGTEIAHFKMTLSPDTGNDLAVLNLVRTDSRSESMHQLAAELTDGELIVNLRAEGDPDELRAVALAGLEHTAREMAVAAAVEHIEHFRPGRPDPTHRMAIP
jgi:hypothetical protein